MKKLAELLAKKDELKKKATALLEVSEARGETTLSEADEKLLVGYNKELADCDRQIKLLEETKAALEAGATEDRSAGTTPGATTDPRGVKPAPVVEVVVDKNAPVFESRGHQLVAIAAVDIARGNGVMAEQERNVNMLQEVQKRATGLATFKDQDGGYLLETQVQQGIEQSPFATGLIAGACRYIPLTGNQTRFKAFALDDKNRADGTRLGGVTASWVKEGETVAASKPKLRAVEIELSKIMAKGYATEEMLEDAPQMAAIMDDAWDQEINFQIDEAVFHGDGLSEPMGFLHEKCQATITQAKESGQTEKVVYQNILKMVAHIIPRLRAGYKWYMNPEMMIYLPQMNMSVGTGGVPVYMPANGMVGGGYDMLYNIPIEFAEQCPAPGTKGDINLLNLSEFGLVGKGSRRNAMSQHVRFEYNELVFKSTQRVGGRVLPNDVITPKRSTANGTMSAFITLESR